MTIEPDVRAVAKNFGLDAALLQAVVTAEKNIVRAVQCSIPSVQTRDEALRVTARSAVHAMSDYVKANSAERFIDFWAERWAPLNAANDPHQLNANWPRNVLGLWMSTNI